MTYFNHLDQYDGHIALVSDTGENRTYARMLAEGDKLAAQVGRRCLVFMVCSNCFESVAAYVGFLRAGIVPVLLNQTLDPELLGSLVSDYHPSFFYYPGNFHQEALGTQVGGLGRYILAETAWPQDYGLNENLALLLTTSGSTGSPKLVRQSYLNIQSNTESIIEYLAIGSSERAITTLPMHYTYGLSIINTHLAQGAALILTDTPMLSKSFWELLRKEGATTFGGVPYIYQMLKKLRFESMDLPSLKYLTQAGGRLEPDLGLEFFRVCQKKGLKFIVMYGQTEATARMSWMPWESLEKKPSSIGLAIPGGRFWLADENNNPIDVPGQNGELVYDGPNVTLGYAENRFDLAKGDEWGGRLFTGDMARFDEEGFFYLTGRKKRFLKLFGSRINLDEVESLLNQEGYVCACGGVDDKLRIFLEEAEKGPEVEKILSGRLALNRAGYKICFIEKIPRNESGKVLYSALD